jgi:serine/threonine protein kinase
MREAISIVWVLLSLPAKRAGWARREFVAAITETRRTIGADAARHGSGRAGRMSGDQAQALIGQWLPGGYRIIRLIGAGAFAWVYYAETMRGEPVAIKVLQAPSQEARTLFTREIKILRQLPSSPYCVQYIDDGLTEEGLPFLAMEFVDGCTLKDGFRFKPLWGVDEACALMLQLCEALSGLHRLGLAHRDLKPENVMLTRTWQVKLMDFGLVKDAQGLLKLFESEDILTGRDFAENIDKALLAGTPEYMAPEQFSDPLVEDESLAKTDTWTDVYSLGLIFYQLLVGKKLFPFESKATDQVGYAREMLAYVRARGSVRDEQIERPAEVPAALWPVLASALRQNPKQRPYNAPALAETIRQYLETGESHGFDDDEESHTSVADMSHVLAALRGVPLGNTAPSTPSPARPPKPPVESAGSERAAPLDVAAIQAYRDQRLNAPGRADYTLPPGMLHASQLPSLVPPPPVRTPEQVAPQPVLAPAPAVVSAPRRSAWGAVAAVGLAAVAVVGTALVLLR